MDCIIISCIEPSHLLQVFGPKVNLKFSFEPWPAKLSSVVGALDATPLSSAAAGRPSYSLKVGSVWILSS